MVSVSRGREGEIDRATLAFCDALTRTASVRLRKIVRHRYRADIQGPVTGIRDGHLNRIAASPNLLCSEAYRFRRHPQRRQPGILERALVDRLGAIVVPVINTLPPGEVQRGNSSERIVPCIDRQ